MNHKQPENSVTNPKTCQVEGCNRPHKANGYCLMHYRRQRNTGTTDGPASQAQKPCSIRDCPNHQQFSGLCYNHYHNFKYHRKKGNFEKVEDYIQHQNAEAKTKAEQTCKDPSCDNLAKVKGFCRKHYQASKYVPASKSKTKTRKPCKVRGCNEYEKTLGLCTNHYQNFQYYRGRNICPDVESYVHKKNKGV